MERRRSACVETVRTEICEPRSRRNLASRTETVICLEQAPSIGATLEHPKTWVGAREEGGPEVETRGGRELT